jgi:uncharacterized protein (TIGR02001 family)
MVCPATPVRYRPLVPAMLAVVLLLPPATGLAEGWQTSLALTSDYILRGVSQTNGDPALQATVAYWHPTGWYGGTWASNVDTARRYYSPAGTQTELNLFIGYGRRLETDWVIDLKAVRYLYLDDPAPVGYDYTEFSVGVAWREHLYASLSVSPDSTLLGRTGVVRDSTVVTGEVSMQQPLSPWLTWWIGAGYQDLSDALHTGYAFGGTSLALQFRHVTLEVGHYRTDAEAVSLFGSRLAGDHTVLTAILNF